MKSIIDKLATQGTYQNSRTVVLGGIPFTMRDVVMTAPLIAATNVYLIGGTGEGKTQLANDLIGFFGNSFCQMEGRPDFEPSELLRQLNLSKLKDAATDREIVELTENVQKAFYYVDELNRCPPIIMNYFFNFFDGKLLHNGKPYRLGKSGYTVGYASGNLGDGAYVGIADVDRALKDRMHMIIKLDDPHFSTTEDDDGHIFEGKKSPRSSIPETNKDCLEDIMKLHETFNQREVPAILPVLGMYFHKGLDYLENTKRHSKRAVDQVWPNVKDMRTDNDENKIFPLSKRAVLASLGLSQALEMIAEAKGQRDNIDSTKIFLDALQLTIPYSGVFSPQYVHNEKDGDAYAAFDDVMAHIRTDILSKKNALEDATAFALAGEVHESALDKLIPVGREGKWAPVRRYIESLAKRPKEEQKQLLSALKEKYKTSEK